MMKNFKLSHHDRRDAIVIFKVLAPFLFVVCIAAYFHEFVIHAVESNIGINCGIIAAACYGIVLIIMRLINAQLDFRVIERFGREARKGVYMQTLLNEPWLKRRYVRHYLSHIAHTGGTLASQMDQTAIENELHALQIEYDSKLELPQFLVGFMIAMGLLGTFIGLLTTLTGISGMLDGMGGSGSNVEAQFMQLVVELRKPLAGMGIAFSASMFGLITSLMLAIMMTNLRRYINRVMSLARNVMHELLEMPRRPASAAAQRSLSPTEIAGMPFESSAPAGSVSNALLAGRFELLAKKIELLLTAFETSNAGMQKMTDLLGFGPRMRELSERTLDELKAIAARHIEHHALLRNLIDIHAGASQTTEAMLVTQRQAKEVGEETLGVLKTLTVSVAEQQQMSHQLVAFEETTTNMLGALVESDKQAKESGEQTLLEIQSLVASITDQRRLLQGLVDVGTETGRAAEGLLESQRQARTEITTLLKALAERLTKVEEANIGGARHLWEIKENFIKLCKSLGVVDLIASGISGQALLLEALVEEARASSQILVSLRKDIHDQGG